MKHQYNQNQIGLKSIGELSEFKFSFLIINVAIGGQSNKYRTCLTTSMSLILKGALLLFATLSGKISRRGNIVWEVIDGQQRLTTIYIILTCLGEIILIHWNMRPARTAENFCST